MFIFSVFIKILMQWEVQEMAQKFCNRTVALYGEELKPALYQKLIFGALCTILSFMIIIIIIIIIIYIYIYIYILKKIIYQIIY